MGYIVAWYALFSNIFEYQTQVNIILFILFVQSRPTIFHTYINSKRKKGSQFMHWLNSGDMINLLGRLVYEELQIV